MSSTSAASKALWVDCFRPKTLDALDYHSDLTKRLKTLASGDVPHLLFYGPSGAGKRTRVNALLRALFGPGVEKTSMERKSIKTPSNKQIDIVGLGSAYHVEFNPSDVGNADRFIVQEVIKDAASSVWLSSGMPSHNSLGGTKRVKTDEGSVSSDQQSLKFKVVVLGDADSLSRVAQHGLRRTMEKYAATCRLILVAESLSRVIEPVRSRCLAIRVPAPSPEEISAIVIRTAARDSVHISSGFAARVAKASHRNLRRALLMAETARIASGKSRIEDDAQVMLPDWERFISDLAASIMQRQSPAELLSARAKIYELLANCIPPELILNTLVACLLPKMDDDELKHKVVEWAAIYEERLASHGQKANYHIEAFVAKFMSLYQTFLNQLFS